MWLPLEVANCESTNAIVSVHIIFGCADELGRGGAFEQVPRIQRTRVTLSTSVKPHACIENLKWFI